MIKLENKQINASVESIMIQIREYILHRDSKLILKDIRDAGQNIMITCPFHKNGEERRPSCGVSNIAKEETPEGVVHCFTCGKTMFIDKLISHLLGYDDDGSEGRKWLIEQFDLSFNRTLTANINRNNKSENIEYISEKELDEYRYYHDYMFKRGLDEDIIEKYDIGYDKYNEAITFPVRDIKGNCLFLAKREIKTKRFYLPSEKNKPLYGVFELDYNKKDIYIVESFFNALTLAKWGYNAIALMGTGSNYQYNLINKLPFRSVYLCFDGDAAGRIGSMKMANAIKFNKNLYVISMTEGKDVNDLTLEEFLKLTIKKY